MALTSDQLCRRYSLADIQLATQNFDDGLVIGQGGFGKVYKGNIKIGEGSSTVVAIKRLDSRSNQGAPEFRAEIEMLSKLRHSHLVSLLGWCDEGKEMILVYEYMPYGSLHHHLHKSIPPLSWMQRLRISIGAARGLDYLHTGAGTKDGVIHRDVKTSNILLDEDWEAKISDFGLAKICKTNQPSTYVNTRVKGTFGYLDPHSVFTGKVTRKTDVFAFGVVLFELLSRRLAVFPDEDDDLNLASWAQDCMNKRNLDQVVDAEIRVQLSPKSSKVFAKMAYRCVCMDPKQRPTMSEVVVALQLSLALQEKFNNSAKPSGLIGFSWKMPSYFVLPTKENSAEEELEVHLGQLERFSLREVQVATDNFSNKNILGRGGFGTVYKGRLADGSLVAVKRLKEERRPGEKLRFQTEVEMIGMAVHRNLLCLRGFCMTPTEWLLVYPYMANGSVASRLRDRPPNESPLDLPTRKRIALGSAQGLSYLHDHCVPKIIHRDVKASNILLDEEFEAVVGDFGLSKLMDCEDTHVSTAVRGTIGHIAPEYLSTGKASEKSDVFGYGTMLLELITGQRAFDLARLANDDDVMLLDWVKGLLKERKLEMLVDSDLEANYVDSEAEQLIQVALLCTQGSPMDRPKMSDVVRLLEGDGLAERWDEWQKEEVFRQELLAPLPNSDWMILDSTENLRAVELSGPR